MAATGIANIHTPRSVQCKIYFLDVHLQGKMKVMNLSLLCLLCKEDVVLFSSFLLRSRFFSSHLAAFY